MTPDDVDPEIREAQRKLAELWSTPRVRDDVFRDFGKLWDVRPVAPTDRQESVRNDAIRNYANRMRESAQVRAGHIPAGAFQPDIISQADRRFTRAEVLAVLKAKKVEWRGADQKAILTELIALFERME